MRKIAFWLFLVAISSAQVENALQQAEGAFRSGNFDQAATLAKQVLARDPSSKEAHLVLGIIASQRRQWDVAVPNFQTVIRLAPSDPQGYFYLGQANLYQQKWDEAARLFASALERSYPDRDRLLIEMAFAQNEGGHPRQALSSLQKAQAPKAGPLAAQYYAATAFALDKLDHPSEAVRAMRRAMEIDYSDPQYREFVISMLLKTNQLRHALVEAIDAQKRFPDAPQIQFLFGLADYCLTNGNLTKVALRNVVEAQPDSSFAFLLRGLVYRREGDQERALDMFMKAAQLGVPDSHLLLALILRNRDDMVGAERELREAARVNPRNAQLHLELGKILLARGETSEAASHLRKAEQYMPEASAVKYQLSLLYSRLGEKGKSSQYLQEFRQLKAKEAELANASGDLR